MENALNQFKESTTVIKKILSDKVHYDPNFAEMQHNFDISSQAIMKLNLENYSEHLDLLRKYLNEIGDLANFFKKNFPNDSNSVFNLLHDLENQLTTLSRT